jgi:hypothetical protein
VRTSEQIIADSRPGTAFSNHSQFDHWASNRGCYICRNDDAAIEKWCPILGVALSIGRTPAEWTTMTEKDHIYGNYTCSEYDERPDDDGGGGDPEPEPGPPPVIPGQLTIGDLFELAGPP